MPKTWTDLLGVPDRHVLVHENEIIRHVDGSWYRTLWHFDTHAEALAAYRAWMHEQPAYNAFVFPEGAVVRSPLVRETNLRVVAEAIRRIYSIDEPLHVEYPGWIGIPEYIVSSLTNGSDSVWAVGPDADGAWTGNLMTPDGHVVDGMTFRVYPDTDAPDDIARAMYAHGIGDLYLGGGCADADRPSIADAQRSEVTRKKKRLALPRAPLPRQRGGAHRVAVKQLDRQRKHKRDWRKAED